MDRVELAWRVEAACLNAWPSARQVLLGAWILRLSGGPTRRTNSVNPLRALQFDPGPVLGDCQEIYRASGQPTIFRAPSLASGMDAVLGGAGYSPEAPSLTLFGDRAFKRRSLGDHEIELTVRPSSAWLAVRAAVNGGEPRADRVFNEMTDLIALPKLFASCRWEGELMAIAYGVLDQQLLVIESVATLSQARGRGLAGRVVSALLSWGERMGAQGACLQVQADNAPARSLYKGLGFDVELYSYQYWRNDF